MSHHSLAFAEEKILRFVKDNPGKSKSDVVRYLKERHISARIATLAYIDRLEAKKMIICQLENPNSQIYQIYINEDNKLSAVVTELEDFKEAYVNLLEKSKGIVIHSKDDKMVWLKWTPLELFCMVIEIMLFRCLVRWPKEINDKEMLSQIYSIVYTKVAKVQFELSRYLEAIATEPETLNIIKVLRGYMSGHRPSFKRIINAYYEVNLNSEISRVIKSISALNEDIKDLKIFSD